MKLEPADTLAILDLLRARTPTTARDGGFSARLQRLRDLVAETETAEPTFAAIAGRVFPGVSENSLRTTFPSFRDALTAAAEAAGQRLALVKPSSRGLASSEIRCHFEGAPPPLPYSGSEAADVLSREPEVVELRARVTRVFVSFAIADRELAEEFTAQMKVNLPLRCMEPVELWRFDDKGGILPGEDNEDEIRRRMAESQFGILLVSPTYLDRPFIQRVELPHFLGPTARAHPIPVALSDFTPGADRHALLNSINVFAHKGKDFAHTAKKDRGEFVKALCEHIAALIAKYPAPPASADPAPGIRFQKDPEICPADICPADGIYVQPKGRPEGSLAKSAGAPEDGTAEGSVPVLETLEKWVRDPAESAYLALLGESGSGKTMTCAKLDRVLNAARPGASIYLDLRHLNDSGLLKTNPNPKLDDILAATLARSANSALAPARVLQCVRQEGALLIWDGLDEVLVHLSAQEGEAVFAQLKEALPPRVVQQAGGNPGRLLIACRTQYFRSFEHEASALTHAQRGPVNATGGSESRARFRVLRLLPFDDEQIRAYLTANVPGLDVGRAFHVIHEVHNLRDLACRPYCLSLMRTSLPDLDSALTAGRRVRSVDLYRSLVRSWLARDGTKHRFDEDDKPRLMARLAAWMWREGAKSLNAERLGLWLKDTVLADDTLRSLYGDAFKTAKSRDELLQDFRTATFIARWDGDSFRFAHTSLQEYFLATLLIDALDAGELGAWALPRVNTETLDFAAQLFLQRGAESAAARTRLESTLAALLATSQPGRSENAFAFLLRLHATGESEFAPAVCDLRGLDLTAWEMCGTPARALRLGGADFSGAMLIRARLHHVEMPGSRWLGADLCSAEFIGCGLEKAEFAVDGTLLEGVRLRACRLAGSRVAGAGLAGLRIELPVWDAATEQHWREALAAYRPVWTSQVPGVWTPPLPTGSTAPAPPTNPFSVPPEACWSLGHASGVKSVGFSPDGSRLVSGSTDNTVRVWDAESGQLLRVLKGHADLVWSVGFSPDGSRLVSGSDDKTVRVWDAQSGQLLRVLEGHAGWVMSVGFSPDGSRLVSGSSDDTVRVWDAQSGAVLKVRKDDRRWLKLAGGRAGREVSVSPLRTIRWSSGDGTQFDAAHLPDGGFLALQKTAAEPRWRIAAARGEYCRYVNHATDDERGRILWPADVLGPIPAALVDARAAHIRQPDGFHHEVHEAILGHPRTQIRGQKHRVS